DWEGRTHAERRNIGWWQRRDVTPVVDDPPPCGAQELGQKIEAGGLARAVWTNERVNGPARDPQVDLADRHKAREFLRQILRFENDLAAHDATSLRLVWRFRERGHFFPGARGGGFVPQHHQFKKMECDVRSRHR